MSPTTTLCAGALLLWLALPPQADPPRAPLREVTPEVAATPAHLYPAHDVVAGRERLPIEYWTDGKPHALGISIETGGTSIRRFPVPRSRGVHRLDWDLRVFPPGVNTHELMEDGARKPPLPLALPGDYVLRLTIDGGSEEQRFRILPDPAVRMTAAERRDWTDAQNALWQIAAQAEARHETAIALREQIRLKKDRESISLSERLRKLLEPLEDTGEHAEGMIRQLARSTRPLSGGDRKRIAGYRASLDRLGGEVSAIAQEMRGRPRMPQS